MPRPARDKKQPYVLFCQEQKETVPELAGKTLPQLVTLCSGAWEKLSIDDRQRYIQMAKEINNNEWAVNTMTDGNMQGRFDSFGRSMLALQQQEELKKYDDSVMRGDIKKRMVQDEDGEGLLPLQKSRFHIMHANVWLESHTSYEIEDELMPAEIGLVEVTLEEGISEVFHQMIHPGVIPRGWKGGMKVYSQKYHQIWLDNENLCDDYRGIMETMKRILTVQPGERPAGKDVVVPPASENIRPLLEHREESKGGNNFLPIFAMPKNIARCKKSLKWLQSHANVDYNFAVYELHEFFLQLLKTAPDQLTTKIPSINLAEAHLDRDVFLYTPGISCAYHHRIESCQCAAATACRQAFIICDFCCQIFAIKALEGRHTPWGVQPIDQDVTWDNSFHATSVSDNCTYERLELANQRPRLGNTSVVEKGFGPSNPLLHPLEGWIKKEADGTFSLIKLEQVPVGTVRRSGRFSAFDAASEDDSFYTPAQSVVGNDVLGNDEAEDEEE